MASALQRDPPSPGAGPPDKGRLLGAEATTLQGAENSASGLTAPRGEPQDIIQGRKGAGVAAHKDPSEEARLSNRLYEQYRSEMASWAEEAGEDKEFYNGSHWTDRQIEVLTERQQNPVEINATYQLVEQAISMLTSRRPSFRATAREDSDVAYAETVSHLMQWIWQQSKGQARAKKAIRDYYVRGLGYLYTYVDPNADVGKGEVQVRDLDPFEVYVDPNSTDPLFDDAAHIIVRRLMSAEQIKALWPDAPLDQVQASRNRQGPVGRQRQGSHNMRLFNSEIDTQAHKQYEVLERFTKVDRPHWRVKNPVSGEEKVLTKDEYREWQEQPAFLVQTPQGRQPVTGTQEVQALEQIYNEVGPTYHMRRTRPRRQGGRTVEGRPEPASGQAQGPRAIPGSTRQIQPTTKGQLVEQGHVESRRFLRTRVKSVATLEDYELYEPFDLPISHYPVVPMANGHNRNPYPISDVRRVKDLQEMINKTHSLILAHASNATNQKVFYPEGSIQDPEYYEEEWNRAGSGWIPYNPEYGENGGINIASPPQLPKELYQNMDRFLKLMQRILGIYPLQQGSAENAPDTFKGTVQIDEFGMRRIKSKMDDIYMSLGRCGEIAIQMAQKLYRPDKVVRLTEPTGQTIEQKLGVAGQEGGQMDVAKFKDMMSTRYDVMVLGGSTLPSNRWAQLENYLEMYDRGIVDDIAVLKKTEIPEADNILRRKSVYKRMQSALKQAQETISDLKGDLQTARREAVSNEKKAELEKFKADLQQYESELRGAQDQYEQQLENELEKQQALLQQERSMRSPEGSDGSS